MAEVLGGRPLMARGVSRLGLRSASDDRSCRGYFALRNLSRPTQLFERLDFLFGAAIVIITTSELSPKG
eukprot:15463909-Alexandrium_andersonii.AAC.1